MLDPLLGLKGHLTEKAANLAQCFSSLDALDRIIDKLNTFACLKSDENTADPHCTLYDRF